MGDDKSGDEDAGWLGVWTVAWAPKQASRRAAKQWGHETAKQIVST